MLGRENPPWTRQTPWQGEPPRTRQTPHPPPPWSRLQNTVYERTVRILLECILVSWYFYCKNWFHGKGLIYSIWPIPLEKEIYPPPPREKTTFTTTCVGKNVLREYIRLARCKLISPGTGENFTPVPESHKLTIKVVDKKSRCNLFIDSATDNVESVSHSLPYFCLSARKKLD